jgi:hypothetical protein
LLFWRLDVDGSGGLDPDGRLVPEAVPNKSAPLDLGWLTAHVASTPKLSAIMAPAR